MSSFLTPSWPEACYKMTLDVAAVVDALFKAGAESIIVKDFHRTGFNILPELINHRAVVDQGYRIGPVPGIGNPLQATGLLMIGMHAPSGSNGFLAHTLTSRISRLEVNGALMSEAELFSASLAPFGLTPLFFSGCPVACHHVLQKIPGVHCYPIDKSKLQPETSESEWRKSLAETAAESLSNKEHMPFHPAGPFEAVVEMRDGSKTAEKLAERWNLQVSDSRLLLQHNDINQLYNQLMEICYLTPTIRKILPLGLHLFNLRGRLGLSWVRRQLQKQQFLTA